jgi:hypothetical protein
MPAWQPRNEAEKQGHGCESKSNIVLSQRTTTRTVTDVSQQQQRKGKQKDRRPQPNASKKKSRLPSLFE